MAVLETHNEPVRTFRAKVRGVFHPATMREKGVMWVLSVSALVLLLGCWILGWYWSSEPPQFDVARVAKQRAEATGAGGEKLGPGYVVTSTVARLAETLLNKRGGYIANDMLPPGLFLDNITNWEFGVLVTVRDAAQALRNHFARAQSQSVENADLASAEPYFNFPNNSWLVPSSESQYRLGIEALNRFMAGLANPDSNARFYERTDNLTQYLSIVEKRLGSLAQRLSASTGQGMKNIDVSDRTFGAISGVERPGATIKTPWLYIDDVFYEARGATWALLHILRAIESDFSTVLERKNAVVSLRLIIRALEDTQLPVFSPVVLNGDGFGIFANYSLAMANYIARANAATIDLRNLLIQG